MPPAIKSGRRTTDKSAPSKTRTRPSTATKRTPNKRSPVKPSPPKKRSSTPSKSAPKKTIYRYYAIVYSQLPYIIPGLKSAQFLEADSQLRKFELDKENQQLAIAHKLFENLPKDRKIFVGIYDETKQFVFLYTYTAGIGVRFAAPIVRNIRTLEEFQLMYWYTEDDEHYVFRFGGEIEPYTSPAYKQTPDPAVYGRWTSSQPAVTVPEVNSIPTRYTGEPGSIPRIYLEGTGTSDGRSYQLRRQSTPADEIAQSAEVLRRASDKTQQPPVITPAVAPVARRRGLFSWLF